MQALFYEEHYFLDYTISKRHNTVLVSISLALIYIMKHTFLKFLFFLLQRQFLTIYDSLNSFAKLRYVCFVMDLYKNNVGDIDN